MADNALDVKDRLDIIDVCTRMALYIDHHRWDELGTLFTDVIDRDYTGIFGGEPERVTREHFITRASKRMPNFAATQHLVSGHIVTGSGDEANCTSQVQAAHYLPTTTGDPMWTCGGQYDLRLVRTDGTWLISSVTATQRWCTGNFEVMRLGLGIR
ncbi:nuclear transport factor 2 family protein [Streptomyces sp. NBC_00873]|uniref:nuclear transport factor 2 family protein n=1 Tax=unclassified Streptomyces TaxID=2593676 RepID=UPI003864C284|nr:nuclear transport factor 2 family protein [Streptomyces sp. NBC_00873]WTA41984.1 nuclear transport factor 2 family protein [Streptomyces sp. NBC_00842]